ncbi:hypothetical protein CPC08DRAFT_822577 [Agrocybe pediades]|nr:hypothetical protein CPC08DRAFT_822577 [Agrocybe pediades]
MADSAVAMIQGIQAYQVITYTRVVVSTIILFDYILTFGEEVRLMWRGKWSIVKILFFVIRYYGLFVGIFLLYSIFTPLITNEVAVCFIGSLARLHMTSDSHGPSQPSCIRSLQWDVSTLFISTLLTEAILLIRIYAMYERSRTVLAWLLLCSALSTSVSSWLLSKDLVLITSAKVVSIPGGVTCTYASLPTWAYAFGIPFVIYDTVLCGFAVYRGYVSFRSSVGLRGNLVNRLLKIMIRDSIFVFIILFLTYLSGMLVWINVLRNGFTQVPGNSIIALANVLSNRMILNIRDSASKQSNLDTSHSRSDFIELSTYSLTPRRNYVQAI